MLADQGYPNVPDLRERDGRWGGTTVRCIRAGPWPVGLLARSTPRLAGDEQDVPDDRLLVLLLCVELLVGFVPDRDDDLLPGQLPVLRRRLASLGPQRADERDDLEHPDDGAVRGGTATYPILFVPQGLPNGTAYHLTINGKNYTAVAPSTILLQLSAGVYPVTNDWALGKLPGLADPPVALRHGAGDRGGEPVLQRLLGHPQGEADGHDQRVRPDAGITWGVNFNGTTHTAVSPNPVTVSGVYPGNYSLSSWSLTSLTGDTTYQPSAASVVSLLSTSTAMVTFTPTFRVSALSGAGGTIGNLTTGKATRLSSSLFVPSGHSVYLNATPASGYFFEGWTGTGTGSYTGLPTTMVGSVYVKKITVTGPITEAAEFNLAPLARYNLTFAETGLPSGVWWTVYLNDGTVPGRVFDDEHDPDGEERLPGGATRRPGKLRAQRRVLVSQRDQRHPVRSGGLPGDGVDDGHSHGGEHRLVGPVRGHARRDPGWVRDGNRGKLGDHSGDLLGGQQHDDVGDRGPAVDRRPAVPVHRLGRARAGVGLERVAGDHLHAHRTGLGAGDVRRAGTAGAAVL